MGDVAILGAGSLGRLWAARLPAAQACFLPRPDTDTSAALRYRFAGPETDTPAIRETYWCKPDEDGLRLLLVTTKAGDTLAALEQWIRSIPETLPVVLFQNGMGIHQQVARQWPDHCWLAASTTEGANQPEPDLLVHAARGTTWVGALNDLAQPHLDTVCQQLSRSGLTVSAESHIQRRLWQKLVVNAGINPFTALLDCRNGELPEQPFYLEHIDGLCEEMARIGQHLELEDRSGNELRRQVESVIDSTAANISSMLGDVRRNRETEIRYINGWLADTGEQLGLATPVNRMLTERVQSLNTHTNSRS